MAVPKKRKSNSRSRQGRTHLAYKCKKSIQQCKVCYQYIQSHRQCQCQI